MGDFLESIPFAKVCFEAAGLTDVGDEEDDLIGWGGGEHEFERVQVRKVDPKGFVDGGVAVGGREGERVESESRGEGEESVRSGRERGRSSVGDGGGGRLGDKEGWRAGGLVFRSREVEGEGQDEGEA